MRSSPPIRDPHPVLVTGGTGFLGSQICGQLVREGREVICLCRRGSEGGEEAIFPCEQVPRIIACDLHGHAATERLIRKVRPGCAVHAAWNVAPGTYLDNPENEEWVHSSLHLLDALLAHGCRSVVMLGTCFEYDSASRYARAKQTLHGEAAARAAQVGAALAWLRIFQPYGPGENEGRLIPSLLRARKSGEFVTLRSPQRILDFIHVDDVAQAVSVAIRANLSGSFDIGTGVGRSIAKVAQCILRGTHSEIHVPDVKTENHEPPLIADRIPMLRATGWEPRIAFEDGIRALIAFRERIGSGETIP